MTSSAPVGTADRHHHITALWTALRGLGIPTHVDVPETADTLEVFARFGAHDWIVNSRNTADETVIRILASMAGLTPRITHQADSLDLVQGMITAGLGVGLLPTGTPTFPQVRLMPLPSPQVVLRAHAVARYGPLTWPPLVLVTDLLARRAATAVGGLPAPVRRDLDR
ncbi:LysR substrate-binding domain-containing protein [Streptomyces sp. Pv4-95]|uniref:LysR substrate-binding domain-containing protein n=1 Tax=Streptomyces sp. Pv4-95 TaxID=3049543 RepID=UPI003891712B